MFKIFKKKLNMNKYAHAHADTVQFFSLQNGLQKLSAAHAGRWFHHFLTREAFTALSWEIPRQLSASST